MNDTKANAQCNSPRKKWLWAILTVLASIGLLVAYVGQLPGFSPKAMAQNDVRRLTVGLQAYSVVFGKTPAGGNSEVVKELGGANPKKIAFCELNSKRFNTAGEFLDPWGTPYQIDSSNPAMVKVYSFGPNKRDDGGVISSDDIIYSP